MSYFLLWRTPNVADQTFRLFLPVVVGCSMCVLDQQGAWQCVIIWYFYLIHHAYPLEQKLQWGLYLIFWSNWNWNRSLEGSSNIFIPMKKKIERILKNWTRLMDPFNYLNKSPSLNSLLGFHHVLHLMMASLFVTLNHLTKYKTWKSFFHLIISSILLKNFWLTKGFLQILNRCLGIKATSPNIQKHCGEWLANVLRL